MNISQCVCVHAKTIPWKCRFLILGILQLFAVNFAHFLKSRLIFISFYCFGMFVNKLFTYLKYPHISKRRKRCSVKPSAYYFLWRPRYWQIFKSALVFLWYQGSNLWIIIFGLEWLSKAESYLAMDVMNISNLKVNLFSLTWRLVLTMKYAYVNTYCHQVHYVILKIFP